MKRIDPDVLHEFASELLAETGADRDVAEAVASSLVAADLRGHPSHGTRIIPGYFRWIEEGPMEPEARATVVAEDDSTVLVDGNHGLGHPVGREATALGIEKVRSTPVATVGIRHATHVGRVGWFAEQAAEAGLGFVGFTNMTSGRPVAPAGSARRRFGTNPVTFSLPSFGAADFPILLDMATSQVAYGKINVREITGEALDPSWTVTESGDPVLDADEFNEEEVGAMTPFGGQDAGYKGTALMLMTELFAATFGDSPVTSQPDATRENAAAFVLFDPLAYTTREAHEARIESLARYLDETDYSERVSAGAAARGDRALLPGEGEHRTLVEYREDGIPMPEPILESLYGFAREQGVGGDVLAPLSPE